MTPTQKTLLARRLVGVQDVYVGMVLAGLIFLSSLLSVELGLSAAIIEIALGVLAGNLFGVTSLPWVAYIAGFGGILLTFLAGAEVDLDVMRAKFKESLFIGGVSFSRRVAHLSLFARLGLEGRADRWGRALDDFTGRRLRCAGRDRSHPHACGQTDHGFDVRHGLRHGSRFGDCAAFLSSTPCARGASPTRAARTTGAGGRDGTGVISKF